MIHSIEQPKKNTILELLSQLCAISAASIGLITLLGWILGLHMFATYGITNIPMAPSTALCFVLFGAALFFRQRYPINRRTHFIGLFVGVVIGLCALLLLYVSLKGIHPEIEHLGFSIENSFDKIIIGHMSPLTAICFVLCALAFLLFLSSTLVSVKRGWATLLLSLLVFFTASIMLIAYLLETPLMYTANLIPPSLPSSLAFLFLSFSMLVGAGLQLQHANSLKKDTSLFVPIFIIVMFIVFTTIIIVGSANLYQSFKRNLRTEISEQLSAISELKVNQMTLWRNERIGDGRLFYKNFAFSASVKRYIQSNNDRDAKKSILTWMEQIQNAYSYNMILLLDPQLNSILQYPEIEGQIRVVADQKERDSVLSGSIVFQDFYRNDKDQKVYLKLLVPILEEHFPNRVIAVLMLRISPERYLIPIVKQWPIPSKTSETLIIRKDSNCITFLNDIKFYNNSLLNLTIPLTKKDVLAVKAATGYSGYVEGIDYRGQEVCGYVRSVPNSPWFIVAKTDKEEAFESLNEKLWQIIIFSIALFFCGGAGIGFLYRYQQYLFYKGQMQLMENVKSSEMRYRRLFEAAQDGILILDAETGRVVDVNPFLIELLGLTKEVFLNRKVWELGFLKDAIANEDNFKELKEKGYVRYEDMAMEAHNGERHEVEFVSNVYVVDGKNVIQCNIRDISSRVHAEMERKKAEETLKVNEALLDSIINNSTSLIYVVDTEGRFLLVNKTLELLFSKSREKLVGQTREGVMPKEAAEEHWKNDVEVMKSGKVKIIDEHNPEHDGMHTYLTIKYPLFNSEGEVYAIGGMSTDITERKRAQDGIKKLNAELETRVLERTSELDLANKELTAFSYSVSHDLRAPLRAIDGFSLALLEDYAPELDDQGKDKLQRIRAATQRMGRLIDDLLSLSRVSQLDLKRKSLNLSSVAQEIANELQKSDPSRDVEFSISPDVTVNGDKELLNIALANLMQNAFKFTSRHAKAQIEFGVTAQNGTRTYFVRDDGAGFDMRFAAKMFGAFQRMHSSVDFSGTGIGLATVRRIVSRHGGKIWAESEVEKGATFYFTLV